MEHANEAASADPRYLRTGTFSAKLGSSANPGRPLERIGMAADRIGNVVVSAAGFVSRFHGPVPASTLNDTDKLTASYANDLDRLFANIEMLERHMDALQSIG